jgi:surface carbohydrate biosynthesis protein (TIGR04326 family)
MLFNINFKDMAQIELKTMLVRDSQYAPDANNQIIVFWNTYLQDDDPNQFSIPALVEENADNLRARYLACIHDIGETHVQGKRLIDHMQLRPEFSYWWMTLLAHKANAFASPRVVDAIKMIAFEDLATSLSVSRVKLVSKDKILADVFRKWCANKGLEFEFELVHEQRSSSSIFKNIYRASPHVLQAMLHLLRQIIKRWPLRKAGIYEVLSSRAELTFCSYLLNLDNKTLNGENFKTGYWTKLHDLLEQQGINNNWIHKYIGHPSIPNPSQAQKLISTLNQISGSKECHTNMNSSLSWRVILQALADYVRVKTIGFKLKQKIKPFFRPQGSDIDMWPFLKGDWDGSMHGKQAVSNCLDLNLSQSILNQIPRQKMGFYLQENQPWEMAYIYAWKNASHGTLIGVPHSTVRYWDLRYFYYSRTYERINENDLPLPDKVALNSPVAVNLYKEAGYPEDQIVEVEALRYLYLEDFPALQADTSTAQSEMKLRILVLGDYSPHVTKRQMELLDDAAHLLPQKISFVCKPHPACPIHAQDYPNLSLHLTTENIGTLFSDCDVAYTSNHTSAAVDAWCAGVPVVSVLSGETLNMSPLRGMEGVAYVSSSQELAAALQRLGNQGKETAHGTHGNMNMTGSETGENDKIQSDNFFYLGKELSRWKSLLSQYF